MCDQNTFAICMVWLKLMHLHKYFDLVSVFIGILSSSQLTIIFASGSDIDFVSRRQAITWIESNVFSTHARPPWVMVSPDLNLTPVCWRGLDCFTLPLARHLADVSCYIGPPMPSVICMEIQTEIVQKRKKKQSRDEGIPRQPHVYL